MLDQILIFILNTILGLLSLALLLRFYMQLINIPYSNPVSHFLVTITDFIVRPTSKFIPKFKGINLSTFLLAWLTQFILIVGIYKLQSNDLNSDISTITIALMLLAFVEIIKTTLHILMIVIIGQAILSWISPHNPISTLLYNFTRPFLKIFSERIPPIGNIDLSPLFVLIIIQFILMITTELQQNIYQLF
ncbi:MAG: osmotic-shock protein [Nitrosomonadaceae bacterium]|nr:osmotic-shock protein [Nitrosomonadaceae bacterium]